MGHTYTDVLLHVVFSTKGRRPTIEERFRQRLHEYLSGIARNEFGAALRLGGTVDHLHGLIRLRPDIALSDAMCAWKSRSSKWVHDTFERTRDFAWQGGYAAFGVSESNRDEVIAYIDHQAEHHRRRTFEEELLALLQRHGIEYDPRYVWD